MDYEGRTHEQCAAQMRVSRTTVTEIYERARHKVADALVNGRTLVIRGGNYEVCEGACAHECAGRCRWKYGELASALENLLGDEIMRIAIPVKNENIYQHFGMASTFKVYDIEEKRVVNTFFIESAGTGHGAKVGPLVDNQVDCVICGGIGEGAVGQLSGAGIFLIAGVSGDADEAVEAALSHSLKSDLAESSKASFGHSGEAFSFVRFISRVSRSARSRGTSRVPRPPPSWRSPRARGPTSCSSCGRPRHEGA